VLHPYQCCSHIFLLLLLPFLLGALRCEYATAIADCCLLQLLLLPVDCYPAPHLATEWFFSVKDSLGSILTDSTIRQSAGTRLITFSSCVKQIRRWLIVASIFIFAIAVAALLLMLLPSMPFPSLLIGAPECSDATAIAACCCCRKCHCRCLSCSSSVLACCCHGHY